MIYLYLPVFVVFKLSMISLAPAVFFFCTDKLDDSLPYAYDEDGDLVYTGNAPEQPIPVKDLQSHNIKLQENGQFSTDYQVSVGRQVQGTMLVFSIPPYHPYSLE